MRTLKNVLIFTPDRDTADHATGEMMHDYSRVFKPEAQRFADVHGVPPSRIREVNVVPTPDHRLANVRGAIEAAPVGTAAANGTGPATDPVDCVVLLCHGWAHGCQLGLTTGGCGAFVAAVAHQLARDVLFVLYACSTGDGEGDQRHGPGGDGGLADTLRDALCAAGLTECTVIGHTLAGHATGNPFVRLFSGAGSSVGGIGGDFIVSPDEGERWHLWRAWLDQDGARKAERGRLRFPCMTAAEIDAALGWVAPQAELAPATGTPTSAATPVDPPAA